MPGLAASRWATEPTTTTTTIISRTTQAPPPLTPTPSPMSGHRHISRPTSKPRDTGNHCRSAIQPAGLKFILEQNKVASKPRVTGDRLSTVKSGPASIGKRQSKGSSRRKALEPAGLRLLLEQTESISNPEARGSRSPTSPIPATATTTTTVTAATIQQFSGCTCTCQCGASRQGSTVPTTTSSPTNSSSSSNSKSSSSTKEEWKGATTPPNRPKPAAEVAVEMVSSTPTTPLSTTPPPPPAENNNSTDATNPAAKLSWFEMSELDDALPVIETPGAWALARDLEREDDKEAGLAEPVVLAQLPLPPHAPTVQQTHSQPRQRIATSAAAQLKSFTYERLVFVDPFPDITGPGLSASQWA